MTSYTIYQSGSHSSPCHSFTPINQIRPMDRFKTPVSTASTASTSSTASNSETSASTTAISLKNTQAVLTSNAAKPTTTTTATATAPTTLQPLPLPLQQLPDDPMVLLVKDKAAYMGPASTLKANDLLHPSAFVDRLSEVSGPLPITNLVCRSLPRIINELASIEQQVLHRYQLISNLPVVKVPVSISLSLLHTLHTSSSAIYSSLHTALHKPLFTIEYGARTNSKGNTKPVRANNIQSSKQSWLTQRLTQLLLPTFLQQSQTERKETDNMMVISKNLLADDDHYQPPPTPILQYHDEYNLIDTEQNVSNIQPSSEQGEPAEAAEEEEDLADLGDDHTNTNNHNRSHSDVSSMSSQYREHPSTIQKIHQEKQQQLLQYYQKHINALQQQIQTLQTLLQQQPAQQQQPPQSHKTQPTQATSPQIHNNNNPNPPPKYTEFIHPPIVVQNTANPIKREEDKKLNSSSSSSSSLSSGASAAIRSVHHADGCHTPMYEQREPNNNTMMIC